MKRNRAFSLLLSSLFCLTMGAQQLQNESVTESPAGSPTDSVSIVVPAYIDSLAQLRNQIFSNPPKRDSNIGAYARLFLPPTFYNSMSGTEMGMDGRYDSPRDAAIRKALLHLYLNRPDLVGDTENQVADAGPILDAPDKRITVSSDMVDREPSLPEEIGADESNVVVVKPNFWKYSGHYSTQMFQNYVSSNWAQGGESNYSLLGTLTLQANYNNKQKVKWDNKLEMRLGFQNSRSDTLHAVKTSEDLLRFTSKLGLQLSKKWYYTLETKATTQFMRNYKSNDSFVYSDFLSPLTVNVSFGLDYSVSWLKNRLTGSASFAPLAYNVKYVDRLELATRNGIEAGKHSRNDFGSKCSFDLNWKLASYLTWKSYIYFYTSYERVEFQFENTFSFKVNKFLTCNFFFHPRFDDSRARDDSYGYWQFKEFLSFGFDYSF